MSLFDKFKGKNAQTQIPDKPLEEMTDDELVRVYSKSVYNSDGVLEYRCLKEEFRRGMKYSSPYTLGCMAFRGKKDGTPLDVDFPLAEVCARAVLREDFNAYEKDFFFKYVLGYYPWSRYSPPSYCFLPDFDALEKDFPCIINAAKKRYDNQKHELIRKGQSD